MDLRRKWDAYADKCDRDIGFFERRQFTGGREWVCGQAVGDVLEVAVGTGRNLPFYPEGVHLTGIDLSPGMLSIAARRAAESAVSCDLREADAQALPFPDATFDTVVCTLGLCGIPDDRSAVTEMHRVLRPGGRLLLLDHIGSHHKPVWLVQKLLNQLTVRMLGDYQTRRPLPLVEAAGFVVERRERLKWGTVERLSARKPT